MCLAIPGRVLSVEGQEPLWRVGRVDFGGVIQSVSLACVPEVCPGGYVLVHAGVALSCLDEVEAEQLLELMRRQNGSGDG